MSSRETPVGTSEEFKYQPRDAISRAAALRYAVRPTPGRLMNSSYVLWTYPKASQLEEHSLHPSVSRALPTEKREDGHRTSALTTHPDVRTTES